MLCLSGGEMQPVDPTIIFRGTGKRIPQTELNQHATGTMRLWQRNAWIDITGMIEWLKQFKLKTNTKRSLWLIQDGDKSHKAERTMKSTRNILFTFTPPVTTDCVSVIDRIAHLFKLYIGSSYFVWADDNFERFNDGFENISAGERRILFSHWVEDSWNLLIQTKKGFIHEMFKQTGILIRKDASDRDRIKIPGLEGYDWMEQIV